MENHPGAVQALGDVDFLARLERGAALARARAAEVRDYFGHAAVIQGFAASLGDKHLYARMLVRGARYAWAGLLVVREAGTFVVTADERPGAGGALRGATLLGCDGRTADALAEERLGGFRADWSVEAQRVQSSPWLLVDDGNPLLGRPARCTFARDGAPVEVDLAWASVAPADLQPHLAAAAERTLAHAGFGVRPFAGGWWVALERLDERAGPVVDEVRERAAELRRAPMVVLDVRGNGGGDSAYGRALLLALMGEGRRAEIDAAGAADCPSPWRASPGNLAALRQWRKERSPGQDAGTRAYYDALETALADAVAAGRPFDEPLTPCRATPPRPPARQLRSELKGRLVLLTDNQCFSSCLLLAAQVRAVGGLHVGEETDAATRYMEVREVTLPSGLATFTTLQKAALGTPARVGPFTPTERFAGDMADTVALEAWIAGLGAR